MPQDKTGAPIALENWLQAPVCRRTVPEVHHGISLGRACWGTRGLLHYNPAADCAGLRYIYSCSGTRVQVLVLTLRSWFLATRRLGKLDSDCAMWVGGPGQVSPGDAHRLRRTVAAARSVREQGDSMIV